MIPLLLAAAAAQTGAQVAAPVPCATVLCDADRLQSFFARLAATRGRGEPVRIVQIGDSHTAGDQITGAWRNALQARYGVGGRGMLAPGRPYQGYLTRGVTAAQSGGWSVRGIFGPSYAAASTARLGLSGYALSASAPGAWLSLTADTAAQAFDRFTVCGWAMPGGGAVQLTAGTTSVQWLLDAPVAGPQCRTIDTPAAATSAQVSVLAGPVTLTSWTVERRGRGGVSLSNLGVVGSQFLHLEREDEALVAAELAVARPDLIVIAFGTNEAFKPSFSAADYDAGLRRGLRRVQRLAPGVPILLLGAPDSATAIPSLRNSGSGEASVCPGQARWAPPAALPVVQAIQRQRASEAGVAYWDWAARMGGRCTADGWAQAVPARMRGDRVHFTKPGADVIAALLQGDLDAAAAATSTPTSVPVGRTLR
ncbi:GDSL-type esterase/lipase family protein [Sphingomonas rubra]|uniref:GDSL-like Lipase/Acylhydrolase n=1 Tax=Sphingomonas rubra TaxID=634430 RepID=A0A1I5RPZ9_9SPHN|nr:GDSL-type esterase/lipase family protein [Sphingomonas rubra]SFP60480.1 GDSL-like Lipase/Acylhydrolase [Sphingomonas rubra]